MRFNKIKTYTTIAIVLVALQTYGQAVPPPIPPPPPPGLPIDGALFYLLLVGACFGIKKMAVKEKK